MKKYANAKDVLPQELFIKVKTHFCGGMLYVPLERNTKEKHDMIIALGKHNVPTKEIAEMVNLTTRRVNQVLAEKRQRIIKWKWKD